ncbi:unnamed protein product [Pipistrellus nathusii]|uniref:Uncharacterized protein n=1 Tax=Pipistrellus nathusii TaxID=59473 RepID=A0ABP0A6N6_PIPNA
MHRAGAGCYVTGLHFHSLFSYSQLSGLGKSHPEALHILSESILHFHLGSQSTDEQHQGNGDQKRRRKVIDLVELVFYTEFFLVNKNYQQIKGTSLFIFCPT